MEPILSHRSALEYWRSVRIGTRSFAKVLDAQPLLDQPPRMDELAEPGPWWLSKPRHVLVSENRVRRTSREVVSHVTGVNLPAGSIFDTQNGFCVCTAELCFVQMANTLTLPKLIELGFELCGTYDTSRGPVDECAPLTTKERLLAFAEGAEFVRGRKKALRALRYVANGSASPRETVLAMLLCLPYALGGYGIEMPLLNQRVDLDKRARRIAGRGYLVCDLYWPEAKLDVEYEGEESHTGIDRVSKDSMRRDALVSMGVTVVSVTKWQLNNGGDLDALAHFVARRTGKQLRYKDPGFTRACLALRGELLGRP